MNAGAPTIALRPVRVSPVLVDDLALTRALRTAPAPAEGGAAHEPDAERWTRAWLVGWQAALHTRGVIGSVEPWTLALAPADWPALRGDPDRRRQTAAVALLARVGLAVVRGDGSATLAERAFVSHRAGLEVDWGAAFTSCRGEPAALLTLRAVVDGLPAVDDPSPLTLRELAARTGYGEKQVRTALHRLVAAQILETREAPGQPTRYRVTDLLLGRSGSTALSAPRGPQRVPADTPAVHAPAGAPPPSAAAAPRSAPAFRVSLNGATIALAAGLTANVELDADGVPHLHIAGPASGG